MTENNHFIIDGFDHTHGQWLSPFVTRKSYQELLQKFETSQEREVKLEHQLAKKDNELTEKNQELTQKNQKLAEKNEKIKELDRTIEIQDENMIKNIAENEKIHATLESLGVEFKKMTCNYESTIQELENRIITQNDENEKKLTLYMKKNLDLEAENREVRQTVANQGSQMNNMLDKLATLETKLKEDEQFHEKENQKQLKMIENLKKSNNEQKQIIEKLKNESKESNKKKK